MMLSPFLALWCCLTWQIASCFVPQQHASLAPCRDDVITISFDRRSPTRTSRGSLLQQKMVRNIDLAEAIIFYGHASLMVQDDNNGSFHPGVDDLLQECQRDETAVLAILEDNDETIMTLPKSSILQVRRQTSPPPDPKDLIESINSIVIQPKGFGGSSGFGSKAADPERPPLPKHCVVLCHTEDQCRAARFAGMRVLCLTDNALADYVVLDEGSYWEGIYIDDIATPGSFWLNPPHPRDDESNAVDPEVVMEAYDGNPSEEQKDNDQDECLSNSRTSNAAIMGDDQLAAILADMDPL